MFLKITQKLPMSIAIKDAKGNAAPVEGAPTWAVTDPSLATLEVEKDGMSAMLIPTGLLGSFKVQVSADADLGPDIKNIIGELDIDLSPAEAVTIALAAGTPVDM